VTMKSTTERRSGPAEEADKKREKRAGWKPIEMADMQRVPAFPSGGREGELNTGSERIGRESSGWQNKVDRGKTKGGETVCENGGLAEYHSCGSEGALESII